MSMSTVSWDLSPKTWNPRVVLLLVISTTTYAIWISRMGRRHWWKWLVLLFMILGVITLASSFPETSASGRDLQFCLLLSSGLAPARALFIHTFVIRNQPSRKQNESTTASYFRIGSVIHEPGRLMIVALLSAFKECDFLYLLHETEMNKVTFPATWRGWRKLLMSKFKKRIAAKYPKPCFGSRRPVAKHLMDIVKG